MIWMSVFKICQTGFLSLASSCQSCHNHDLTSYSYPGTILIYCNHNPNLHPNPYNSWERGSQAKEGLVN
jgi:hypothetical protein